jgi:hypothetical protein
LPQDWLRRKPKRIGLGVIQSLLKHASIECSAEKGKNGVNGLVLKIRDYQRQAAKAGGGKLPVHADLVTHAVSLIQSGSTVTDACSTVGCSRKYFYEKCHLLGGLAKGYVKHTDILSAEPPKKGHSKTENQEEKQVQIAEPPKIPHFYEGNQAHKPLPVVDSSMLFQDDRPQLRMGSLPVGWAFRWGKTGLQKNTWCGTVDERMRDRRSVAISL